MDNRDWLDELLSKTDLVQVVSRYVSLTKKGNNYWACCPFHHEKTPSFSVTPGKQLYYCYGCHEGGNAITFIKKIESVESGEAIRILAEAAHMTVPEFKTDKKQADIKKKKERLTALMRDAALHYHENLKSEKAKIAQTYIKERQISSMVTKFGIGFSLGRTEMLEFLKSKGYSYAEMKEAGIAEQSADSYYDVFMNRLIIPIINPYGNVIGFGGRILDKDTKFAKYRNSTQTILFDKSRVLFALNLVKKTKQREGINSIIITEGYMDTISLFKAGFENVVASMGTSLTLEQAKQLKNYCSKVYISYDGDGAGQKATLRGLDILESVGLSVRVVKLPEGKDPDDVIKSDGKEGYEKLLESAVTLTTFKIDSLAAAYDMSDPDGKSKFAVEAIKIIKKLDNPVEQEEYLKHIHKLTDYSMNVLLKQAEMSANEDVKITEEKQEQRSSDSLLAAEQFVLASLIYEMPYADFSEDIFPLLSCDEARVAYNHALEKYKNHYTLQSLYNRVDQPYQEYVKGLLNYDFMKSDDKKKFDECIYLIKRRSLMSQKEKLSVQFEEAKDSKERKEILAQIDRVEKQLKQMKKNGGYYG
ncbi:MAG: DNA primase [Clostridiales bacterium]|nr:DNA primase [Clostridiales bacterium]